MDDADSLSPQLFENMPILNPMAEQLEEAPVVEMVTDEIGEEIAIPEAATIVESVVVSKSNTGRSSTVNSQVEVKLPDDKLTANSPRRICFKEHGLEAEI